MIVLAYNSVEGRLFIAEEPFIFIIREKESNAMIFMGQIENPVE